MSITFDYYNVDSLFYVYPDRLGSYTLITNSSKQVVRALHFDPWGNVKSDGYFHSDYLFGSAAPRYINYSNCVNLENTLAYAFHEPDRMTDADGTSYRTEYYWAAVGAGGAHQYKVGKGHWKRILSSYKEYGRWYSKQVETTTTNQYNTISDAIGISSGLLGVGSSFFYNKTLNSWLGKNGKFYDMNFNGNQYTGGKIKFAKQTRGNLLFGGNQLGIVGLSVDLVNFASQPTIESKISYSMNIMVDAIGFTPIVGPAICLYWNMGGEQLHWMWYNKVLMPEIQYGINPGLMFYQPFK